MIYAVTTSRSGLPRVRRPAVNHLMVPDPTFDFDEALERFIVRGSGQLSVRPLRRVRHDDFVHRLPVPGPHCQPGGTSGASTIWVTIRIA